MAESFYKRKGFSLTKKIVNNDYELDSYEKTIIYTVLQKKQITSKNVKHHFHYCTLDQMIKDEMNHHRCVTTDHYHSVTLNINQLFKTNSVTLLGTQLSIDQHAQQIDPIVNKTILQHTF